VALTVIKIEKSKKKARPYKLADGGGLYLAVMPTGGKLWRWKYRFDSKEKLMALGSHPVMTLAEARERRDKERH
jgi:hypothetical protein